MYKEMKCPLCNRLMIGISYRWEPVSEYRCPVHGFTEQAKTVQETKIDPKYAFRSLKD